MRRQQKAPRRACRTFSTGRGVAADTALSQACFPLWRARCGIVDPGCPLVRRVLMFKIHYRMQTGVGMHFAADAATVLDHIVHLTAAGATALKVTDAKGQRFTVESLADLRARGPHALELLTIPGKSVGWNRS